MSKKKHPEHVNHERWLVSYADFITLLFAFFVVLFASSQSDKKKAQKLGEAISAAFTYNGVFEQHAKTPPISDDAGNPTEAPPVPIALALPTAVAQAIQQQQMQQFKEIETKIDDLVKAKAAAKILSPNAVDMHLADEGLVVSLREAGFFNSGSAEVRPEALDILRAIAATLPHQPMRIEGHTDNRPIHTAQFATNWELSTARAAGIARFLIQQGVVDPVQISASGYAEFHPVASNDTDEGRRQNRRVDIILLKPPLPVTEDQLKQAEQDAARAAKKETAKKLESTKPEPTKPSAPPSFLPPIPPPRAPSR
jgi:chemotaxis protein MotB